MTVDNLNNLSINLRNLERDFKEKIEPYRSDLWRYCYSLTRSPWDAEDLVQDTLLKSFSILSKLYQPVKTKSILFKIATNLFIDQKRKDKHLNFSENDEFVNNIPFDDDLQLLENIDFLVTSLTSMQYVVLILSDVFKYKGKEIAEIVGTTEGAIYTNLSRAREQLRNGKKKEGQKNKTKNRDIEYNKAIDILLEGFRSKDPTLISSILDENVVTDITHSGIEFGSDETKNNSLKDWYEIVQTQHIDVSEYKMLWGRPVIIELEKKHDNQLYLNNVHYIETVNGKITYWKFYCFSWDLMEMVSKELKVNLNAEYFYHIF
ncbi:RNA polymerase sigma factor [Bacillus alkalicellulosilyticus]|uniref:RNA polymerase sigma factor n=1 Tax=Alkalihalobacterium alkalicellulosilyticum TaxID=1912214 RepID=UPI000997C6C0|nr:RNA polymerase sigma factor [Bacillus alkalicellulosilyticus]